MVYTALPPQPQKLRLAAAMADLAALIPVWQPEASLPALVSALVEAGFSAIIVVDDGSSAQYQTLLDAIAEYPEIHLIRHAVNMGKGRVLKTGMNYFLNTFPDFRGIVTADADGQHTCEDILAAAMAFDRSPRRMILGARQFSAQVPLRSRFGNLLTRKVFGFLTGRKVSDTQSGLRVIPTALIPELLTLPGERYEYEMTMLTHVCRVGQPPLEVPIQTVYLDGNRTSHFDPIRDSMRIYFILFRFYLSSMLSSGLDLISFTATYRFTGNLLVSVLVGRAVLGPLVNFAMNRQFVFHKAGSVGRPLLRYYLLASFQAVLTWVLIRALTQSLGLNVILCKVLVEAPLSLVSFAVQRIFVFGTRSEETA